MESSISTLSSLNIIFLLRAVSIAFFSFINLLTNFILIATAKFLNLPKTILKTLNNKNK